MPRIKLNLNFLLLALDGLSPYLIKTLQLCDASRMSIFFYYESLRIFPKGENPFAVTRTLNTTSKIAKRP